MELEKASKEELKKEAVKRLELLKMNRNIIKEFEEENILNKSEGRLGILYWLDEKEQSMVKEYEKENDVLVYHIIKTYTLDIGKIYDLLYLTDEKEYWEEERLRLESGYVLSHSISQFSESGDIFVENRNGGLVRIY